MHERYKSLLGRIIETITEELSIPIVAVGSTTFQREDLDRGLEADECFYIASAGKIRDWTHIDLTIDPPPDLAIEIDTTSNSRRRMGIYAALGVSEVWRFDGTSLIVLRLGNNGAYQAVNESMAFPFLPMQEIARFLREYSLGDDTSWAKGFREWFRTAIAPVARGQCGEASGPPKPE
jgi:Uma2 family endonuclease